MSNLQEIELLGREIANRYNAARNAKTYSELYRKKGSVFNVPVMEMSEVIDRNLLVYEFARITGEKNEYLEILAETTPISEKDSRFALHTSSKLVMQKLECIKKDGNLPIKLVIKKVLGKNKREYFDVV